MAGLNEVGKSAVAELVSVIAVVGTLFAEPDLFPPGLVVGPQTIRPATERSAVAELAVGGSTVAGGDLTTLQEANRFGAGTIAVAGITVTGSDVYAEPDVFYAGALNGGDRVIVFDPAASEQITRAARGSVPMTSLWRGLYTVNGSDEYSAWTPIGETLRVPKGAIALGYEYGGDPIVGGLHLVVGGHPHAR